jgi:hypothetical protein
MNSGMVPVSEESKMKQIIKLAELNMAVTLANRAEIAARANKDEEAIELAKLDVEMANSALDKHLNSKKMEAEFAKYESKLDKVSEALGAAGFDDAVLDFFG